MTDKTAQKINIQNRRRARELNCHMMPKRVLKGKIEIFQAWAILRNFQGWAILGNFPGLGDSTCENED